VILNDLCDRDHPPDLTPLDERIACSVQIVKRIEIMSIISIVVANTSNDGVSILVCPLEASATYPVGPQSSQEIAVSDAGIVMVIFFSNKQVYGYRINPLRAVNIQGVGAIIVDSIDNQPPPTPLWHT
jgi:hypothetical protein